MWHIIITHIAWSHVAAVMVWLLRFNNKRKDKRIAELEGIIEDQCANCEMSGIKSGMVPVDDVCEMVAAASLCTCPRDTKCVADDPEDPEPAQCVKCWLLEVKRRRIKKDSD